VPGEIKLAACASAHAGYAHRGQFTIYLAIDCLDFIAEAGISLASQDDP